MEVVPFFLLILKACALSTGGLGPLPILHADFIARGWASEREFTEALAVGQSSPGPNGLWLVSFGYLTGGLTGALLAFAAMLIPPFSVLLVQKVYDRIADQTATKGFMDGMTLAIAGTGLVIFGQLLGADASNWRAIVIFAGAFILTMSNRVPVILVLALAAVAGAILF